MICEDTAEPKRLRLFFKPYCAFGEHPEYSLFGGDLNPAERIALESKLYPVIDHKKGHRLFVKLGPTEGRGDRVISALGTPCLNLDRPCFVF